MGQAALMVILERYKKNLYQHYHFLRFTEMSSARNERNAAW